MHFGPVYCAEWHKTQGYHNMKMQNNRYRNYAQRNELFRSLHQEWKFVRPCLTLHRSSGIPRPSSQRSWFSPQVKCSPWSQRDFQLCISREGKEQVERLIRGKPFANFHHCISRCCTWSAICTGINYRCTHVPWVVEVQQVAGQPQTQCSASSAHNSYQSGCMVEPQSKTGEKSSLKYLSVTLHFYISYNYKSFKEVE